MEPPRAALAVGALAALAALAVVAAAPREPRAPRLPARQFDLGARKGGAVEVSQPCAGCHPGPSAAWRASQHASACRANDPSLDPAPAQGPGVAAWIGVAPLRQGLVPRPGGRYQVYDPALDARSGEWFSIAGREEFRPDEWGHWTQRGMNWNSQCASCHMTDLRKGYEVEADAYRTTWVAAGVACSMCHGDTSAHLRDPARPPAGAPGERASEACVPCHSRREELAEGFRPGDALDDFFRPLLADEVGLYHPDGQARDEVFEAGSLALSRMGRAGVACLDCHEPHSGGLRAPGDSLCLGCHAPPGRRGAALVDPQTHAHHAPDGPGARCVSCHMPEKIYMARDARRDHAFSSPDPGLSREIGAPDACEGCHPGREPGWAERQVEAWYGKPIDRPASRRARALARARRGEAAALPALLALAQGEPNAAWRASLTGALGPFADDPSCRAFLASALGDPSPPVRAAAVRGLARFADLRPRLVAMRGDPSRLVRLAASWATRSTLGSDERARGEAWRWLELNADQPAGALRQSEMALVEARHEAAVSWARKAVQWDPSGPSYHTLARALAAAGRQGEAREALEEARARMP